MMGIYDGDPSNDLIDSSLNIYNPNTTNDEQILTIGKTCAYIAFKRHFSVSRSLTLD